MSLDELHAFALDILKDIDSFCRPRGLRYSLGFGTLLGAVRHKGFIPWDDDIDLMMPREDYIRFREEYKSDKYRFIDRECDSRCYITFGRVIDTERSSLIGLQPWHSRELNSGVWVDIFPMDYVPDSRAEYDSLYNMLNILLKYTRKVRRMHAWCSPELPLRLKLKYLTRTTGHPRLKKADPSQAALDLLRLEQRATAHKTNHLGSLACADTPQFYFDSAVFDSYIDLPFEGCMFRAPEQYDLVLRTIFGDNYMQLPPAKCRKTDLYRIGNVYWL